MIVAVGSLLLALLLALDLLPFLRGGELWHWQWRYDPAPLARAIPLLLATGGYLAGLWALRRTERAGPLLVWSFLGAAIMPLAVVALRADDVLYELFARTASGLTTGPHLVAAELDWGGGAWRDWPAVMAAYHVRSGHVALSPPGLVMGYGLLNAVFAALPGLADPLFRALLPYQCHNFTLLVYTPAEWASAWFGMLMPLWAALTVFPLYAVARRLGGAEAARRAVTWWALVPALVMFAASWNTVYSLLSVTAFWLLLVGLERERGALWLVLSGAVSGLLTFANFAAVPLPGLFGFYVLLQYLLDERRRDDPLPWTRPVMVGVWFGTGLILPWLLYWLASGLMPFDLLAVALPWHLSLERDYVPWLWMHSWEWALFTGVPLVALWLWAAWRRARRWRETGPVLGLALLLTMIVLVLSGTARGETGRVWLFFAPFVLLAAVEATPPPNPRACKARDPAGGAGERNAQRTPQQWAAITVAQAALMLALAITWPVMEVHDLTPPPDPPGGLEATRPAGATFGDSFRLAGWDADVGAGTGTLRLDWQAIAPMTTPYWFAALPVAPDGTTPAEAVVWQAVEGRYPTTCWTPGERVGDTVTLPLPPDAPAGEWWISLSAFADVGRADERLPVMLPDGSQDTQVGLGPVLVP